ncbi:MAG: hypothetical protein DWB99_03370 [Candidatus Poseidoniales archaeon]|nr:MAG: hypothetical protein DWB99_03370 [Candidatus Poseidoniales archaeon]|tara:strand:- start:137 stop:808 length:672 start_codon:yes stop_codon:yes gene_type:complete
MAEVTGHVQYRFRSDEQDTNILLRGESEWVRQKVEELGLTGLGWIMPFGQDSKDSKIRSPSKSKSKPNISVEEEPLGEKPSDMGPTPDPSRVPVVRRPIGQLDLSKELQMLGIEKPIRPDTIELMEIFSNLDTPRPVQGPMSVDPMAEAWLRELLTVVVREYGSTALRTQDIEEIASKKLGNREGSALEVWLDSLFSAGKLVKVHGPDAIAWGPSPRWLIGKI